MELNIRLANVGDCIRIAAVDPFRREEQISQAIAERQCFTAASDSGIVGFFILNDHFFGNSFIDLLIVRADCRCQGIGTALIDHAKRNRKTRKLFTSTNESNAPMQALLAKTGFRPCGQVDALDEGDPERIYIYESE